MLGVGRGLPGPGPSELRVLSVVEPPSVPLSLFARTNPKGQLSSPEQSLLLHHGGAAFQLKP